MKRNSILEIGSECCGCHACEQKCPQKCITFLENAEGFFYPNVNENLCIDCGRCKGVCPIINPFKLLYNQQESYAAHLKDKTKLSESSSGGVFSALAEGVIRNGGYVCGCGNDDQNMPKHKIVNKIDDLADLKGSKYVQSDLTGVYKKIEELLSHGKTVLFVATPCQVAGLKKFLDKDYEKLLCVDIICHGVPSRRLFSEYLAWIGKTKGGKVNNYLFRSKNKHGWSLTYRYNLIRYDGKVDVCEKMASLDPYYYSFLQGTTYRESCYKCPYSCSERPGDITLGDYWGIQSVYPEYYNFDGVSAVIVNSYKGKHLLDTVKEYLEIHQTAIDSVKKNNGNLNTPSFRPKVRDKIYADLNEFGFAYIAEKYMHPSDKVLFIDSIKDKIPNKFRQGIKKIISK